MAQWYPTREILRPWPGLVTKEKTMKYPTSAMCTVCVHAGMAQCYTGRALEFAEIKLGLEEFKNISFNRNT